MELAERACSDRAGGRMPEGGGPAGGLGSGDLVAAPMPAEGLGPTGLWVGTRQRLLEFGGGQLSPVTPVNSQLTPS